MRETVIVFARCMSGVLLFSSAVLLPTTPYATIPLFLSSSFLLACMVADGLIGSWRETRDYYEQRKAAEEAQRMARQFRRTMDLYDFERRQEWR